MSDMPMTQPSHVGPSWDLLCEAEPETAVSLRGRVNRGAALLDLGKPGWPEKVAMDRLAMETCDRCVIGQVYGNYWPGFKFLLKHAGAPPIRTGSAFGFTLTLGESSVVAFDPEAEKSRGLIMLRFAALADLWRAEVRARLEMQS